MNQIYCLLALLSTASASGHSIRVVKRALMDSEDNGLDNSETESSMSFRYEEPPTTQNIPESLDGTSWKSIEIALGSDIIKPITLSFGSSFIYGTTGCNRYRVDYEDLTNNSFLIVGDTFSITRMYCELTDEQERNYMNFLGSKTFSYEIVSAGDENGAEVVQLVLFDGEMAPGAENVARFSQEL